MTTASIVTTASELRTASLLTPALITTDCCNTTVHWKPPICYWVLLQATIPFCSHHVRGGLIKCLNKYKRIVYNLIILHGKRTMLYILK